jgi:hypothetical protein
MAFLYTSRSIGLGVSVGALDDQGWEERFVNWSGAPDEQSLADAIVEAASVPRGEVEQFADTAL